MATAIGAVRLSSERKFYLSMATVILLIVFIGFAPSYYLRGIIPAGAPLLPLTPLVMLHGVLFTGWILLFMTQVSLISAGRADLHRRLGIAGFALLAAMIVVGTLSALHGVARASGPPGIPPLAWLAVPLVDIPMFGILIGGALYQRRNAQTHKRLMLIAMIGMLSPALGRALGAVGIPLPIIVLGTFAVFLGALATWDVRSRGKVHPVTIWAGAFLVGTWVFRLAVWQTPAWLSFAGWAAGLVA